MSDYSTPRSGPRAGFGTRLVAAIVDGVILGVVNLVLSQAIGAAGSAVSILIGLGYYGYLEGSPSGQTVGKRLLNIRVIDFTNGEPLGFGKALVRYVGRIPSTIVCLLGYFWMLWDDQQQTWHDKIAGTVVVPTSDYPVQAWPG